MGGGAAVERTDFFPKVRSKELKILNLLRAYEPKFGPNLDCRTKNS